MNRFNKIFRIQYASDLHLEHYDKVAFPLLVKPAARYLALAGDIGNPHSDMYRNFMSYVSKHWEQVFLVAGNHEFYQGHQSIWSKTYTKSLFETQNTINTILSPYKNVHYLHHDSPSVYLSKWNLAILGSTFWSHVPNEYLDHVKERMGDYKKIPMYYNHHLKALHPIDTNIIHTKEKKTIESYINYWYMMKANTIILTHHLPSMSLVHPYFINNPIKYCFASNSEHLMRPNVLAWIYGHTHQALTGTFGNTFTAVNARGRPSQTVSGYRNDAVIEIDMNKYPNNENSKNEELVASAAGILSPFINRKII